MLIARADMVLGGGGRLKRGDVIPPGTLPEPEYQVRAGLVWHLPDEALAYALEHLRSADTQPKAQAGGKRR